MPILCLEGPSAVGKSATAAALAAEGAVVVPEADLLFERPANESPTGYLERQVERWSLAADASSRGALAVLDGDPFQPLWYNWAYGFVGWQPLGALEAFYRPRIERGEIGFPDRTVLLGAPEAALRERKEGDASRRRRAFERHLPFVGPQRRYFEALQALSPDRVHFLEVRSVAATARAVQADLQSTQPDSSPVELFDALTGWLRTHAA